MAILSLASVASAQQGVRWDESSVEAAQRKAVQTGQLILAHFWSPSCGPCRNMERNVFTRPDVAAAIGRNFVAVKVNADHFPHTCRQYGITALPTDLILTPDGRALQRYQGEAPADVYIARLDEAAAAARGAPPAMYAQQPQGPPNVAAAPVASNTAPPVATQANWGAYADAAAERQRRQTPLPLGGGTGRYDSQTPPADELRQQGVNPQYADDRSMAAGPAPNTNVRTEMPPARQSYGSPQTPVAPQAPPVQATLPQQGYAQNGPAPGYQQQPVDPRWHAPTAPAQADPQTNLTQNPMTAAANPGPAAPPAPVASLPPGSPPLGLDGYCPVELGETRRWVVGDRQWGAIHLGRTYLFSGPEQQRRFLEAPDNYAPVISGDDVVLAMDRGQSVAGHREHGVFYHGRVFLFSSEESLAAFAKNPSRYADQVMQSARTATQQYR